MKKRAIILAGGKGTRLRPYTISLPKPLVPVGDEPILEIVIKQLAKYGFEHITITLNHMANVIKAYFDDGKKWGVYIDYSLEDQPLSTMGPLTLINDLPDNFLVMNGDILTDLNFSKFFLDHNERKNIFSIAAYSRSNKLEYGVLNSNAKNELIKFEEKPSSEYLVSTGIYMASKRVLDFIPKNTFFGFDHLMNALISSENFPIIDIHRGFWLDIGRPDDYEQAVIEISKKVFY